MENIWSLLSSYESVDIVKREYRTIHQRQLNSAKAFEITSHFIQGRNYYESAKRGDMLIKPLLLYYGVLAFSRGLILFLSKTLRETSLSPKHGLSISGWNDIFASPNPDLSLLKVSTTQGTFTELIQVTENSEPVYIKIHYGHKYHLVKMPNLIESLEFSLIFGDLLSRIPDIKDSFEFVTTHPSKAYEGDIFIENPIGSYVYTAHLKFLINKQGYPSKDILRSEFSLQENTNQPQYIEVGTSLYPTHDYSIDLKYFPRSTEIPSIKNDRKGKTFIVSPMDGTSLNTISQLFAVSYYCGMLVRYYPTKWRILSSGTNNDLFLPLFKNTVQLIEELYPEKLYSHLNFHNVK